MLQFSQTRENNRNVLGRRLVWLAFTRRYTLDQN